MGRGPAKKVIPSVRKNDKGKLLEDCCPHSFSLPANKGTKELRETLRVHGQRFVSGKKYELEFKNDHNGRLFYIYFEDHAGKQYITQVEIHKVRGADGRLEELRKTPGIEIWKVMDNKPQV